MLARRVVAGDVAAAAGRRWRMSKPESGGDIPTNPAMGRIPKWLKKVAVQWHTIEDKQRERFVREYNHSRWTDRFVQQFLYQSKKTTINWHDTRQDLEPDEKCFKQKPLGIKGFHMGDRIWPIAMLQRNVIYISAYTSKLTLVIIPGSPMMDITREVRDQCLVPIAYWNPKCEVRPFVVDIPDSPSVSQPPDVLPYWVVKMVDGTERVVPFPADCTSKHDVIYRLQEEIHKLDAGVDKNKYYGVICNTRDKNGWIRVKTHNLDAYTIEEHCPKQYV
eukprot:Sspe_Gene.96403::Locus_69083_Transcript_1_1_Confidence_1.000_Length_999::g.96403::m.96403